jgi:hypothetical protein
LDSVPVIAGKHSNSNPKAPRGAINATATLSQLRIEKITSNVYEMNKKNTRKRKSAFPQDDEKAGGSFLFQQRSDAADAATHEN